jgi:vitamin B12 transporter
VAYQFVSDRYLEYTTYPAPTYDPVLNTTILKDYKQHQCALRIDENRLNILLQLIMFLDKDFVESRGYSTRGRNFKIGLNFILKF